MAVLAKDLRMSIIESAIQGKLTKRLSSDSSAKELLEEIKNNKPDLLEVKKIKNEPQMAELNSEDYPLNIPDGWELCLLGDIIVYQNGYAYKSTDMNKVKKGMPVIKSQNLMTLKTVIGEKNDYIEKPTDKMLASKIEKNDLLMCLSSQSSNPEPLGKTAIYDLDEPALLNQRVLKMTLVNNEMLKYIFYVINSHYFHYTVSHRGDGSAQSNLKLEHVREMIIPIPPIEEQKRIVEKLEEILPQIDEYEKTEMKLEALKKEFPDDMKNAILQAAMQGKLTEQLESDSSVEDNIRKIEEELENYRGKKIEKLMITDDEIPFEIPSDWRFVRLGEVCKKIHYGYTTSAQSKGNVRLLRITDIQDNFVDWKTVPYCDVTTDEYEKYGLNNRDIMIARTGGTIGKTYIVDSLDDKSVFASYLIRAIPSNYINEKYLKKFMESPSYWKQLIDFSNGTGQPNVNAASLGKLIVPLPPIEEQERIVEKLEQFLPLCDDLK